MTGAGAPGAIDATVHSLLRARRTTSGSRTLVFRLAVPLGLRLADRKRDDGVERGPVLGLVRLSKARCRNRGRVRAGRLDRECHLLHVLGPIEVDGAPGRFGVDGFPALAGRRGDLRETRGERLAYAGPVTSRSPGWTVDIAARAMLRIRRTAFSRINRRVGPRLRTARLRNPPQPYRPIRAQSKISVPFDGPP